MSRKNKSSHMVSMEINNSCKCTKHSPNSVTVNVICFCLSKKVKYFLQFRVPVWLIQKNVLNLWVVGLSPTLSIELP